MLVTVGLGGAWVSTLSKLEPLRPALIAVTVALLTYAWRKLYWSPDSCGPDELCADPKVRPRQRLTFWLVSIALTLLLTFPWYAFLFY